MVEWAQSLKPHERKRLRCPYRGKEYRVPSANTLRYFLQDLNPGELEQAVRMWIKACGINTAHTQIAIDGKVLCGSGGARETCQAQLSAYCVEHGSVVHQSGIPHKKSEITAARSLLDDMDLNQTLVSADAAHTNRETAMKIVEKGGSTSSRLRATSLDFWMPSRASVNIGLTGNLTTTPVSADMVVKTPGNS